MSYDNNVSKKWLLLNDFQFNVGIVAKIELKNL